MRTGSFKTGKVNKELWSVAQICAINCRGSLNTQTTRLSETVWRVGRSGCGHSIQHTRFDKALSDQFGAKELSALVLFVVTSPVLGVTKKRHAGVEEISPVVVVSSVHVFARESFQVLSHEFVYFVYERALAAECANG